MKKIRTLHRKIKPGVALLLGIFILILLGSFFLHLPATSNSVSFIDALFTSTSALCVTGLITVDTATDYTIFGQALILLLIQIGGLGVMSVAAAVSLFAGYGLGVNESRQLRDMFQGEFLRESRKVIKFILGFTFIFELVGTILLYIGFDDISDPLQRLWVSLFHSVSAFCNAGFSVFSDSLIGYSSNPVISYTVVFLLVAGGLGFAVAANLLAFFRGRAISGRNTRVSVQTKVVVSLSVVLLFAGAIMFYLFEYNNGLATKSLSESVMASMFQSATTRTAGFNTIEIGLLSSPTLFMMMILMFIGGAPGSTAGGIKITTLAILWANTKAIARGEQDARLFDRAVSNLVLRQALMVFAVASACAVVGLILLLLTEGKSFLVTAFETFSALGTVGLSLGLTPNLSVAGKVVVMILMFIGRVGPLAVAYGLVKSTRSRGVRYPEGRFIVG